VSEQHDGAAGGVVGDANDTVPIWLTPGERIGRPDLASPGDYECYHCRRGQCARCNDPACTCCYGNED
jgi:aconitase B